MNDVAKRLHVSPQRLTSAIKAAEIDRLNAAVKNGRLTQSQANAIKHAIEAKGPPFVPGSVGPGPLHRPPGPYGGPPGPLGGALFFGHASPIAAAAGYLGLSVPQLFNELRSGRSVAQIAKARGKSVSGLERAVTAAIKSKTRPSGRLGASHEIPGAAAAAVAVDQIGRPDQPHSRALHAAAPRPLGRAVPADAHLDGPAVLGARLLDL